MDNVMGKYRKTCELQRQEAVKILAERHGITGVDDESEGMTPLTCAASAGHAECVRLLLHYGAAPDLEDEIDETPLEAAEETGQKECAKLIREAMG